MFIQNLEAEAVSLVETQEKLPQSKVSIDLRAAVRDVEGNKENAGAKPGIVVVDAGKGFFFFLFLEDIF